jgi:hypothetical protein
VLAEILFRDPHLAAEPHDLTRAAAKHVFWFVAGLGDIEEAVDLVG